MLQRVKASTVRGERGEQKSWLKTSTFRKLRPWHLVTSWQIEGKTVEAVTDFVFLVSKITADSDCSHEIRRRLLLGRKAMTNLDGILKAKT